MLHRSWLTSGNPLRGCARATSQTSIWSEQVKESCTREAYDESPSPAGLQKTFEQWSKHHRNQSRRQWTADPLLPPLAVPKEHEDKKVVPTETSGRRRDARRGAPDTRMTPGPSSSSRGEKRTETQEATSVKKRLTTKPSTDKRTAAFADEPVRRRPTGKKRTQRTTTCSCHRGDRGCVSVEHGAHTPQQRDQCGNESLEWRSQTNK